VRKLFVNPTKRFSREADGRMKTIADYLTEQDMPEADRIVAILKAGGIDPATESMIGFWRRHAAWTHDILKGDVGPDIDEGVVTIAASHHLIEGQNPAQLDVASAPAEAELLAMIDKYQAFRVRLGFSHEDAIAKLRGMIDGSAAHPDTLRAMDHTVLGILDRHREALDGLLG
jgi:hypothetical protein